MEGRAAVTQATHARAPPHEHGRGAAGLHHGHVAADALATAWGTSPLALKHAPGSWDLVVPSVATRHGGPADPSFPSGAVWTAFGNGESRAPTPIQHIYMCYIGLGRVSVGGGFVSPPSRVTSAPIRFGLAPFTYPDGLCSQARMRWLGMAYGILTAGERG